jgi:soluble lytic murein transglycosylase-like protein
MAMCAIAGAAALLLALAILYLMTVHIADTVRQFARDHAAPRAVRGIPYADLINRAAAAHRMNPAVIAAVVVAESEFDPRARSLSGAYGLMQIMPATWREMGTGPPCAPEIARLTVPPCMEDPAANLEIGTAYLRQLLNRFGGNLVLAVAAYNAGAETVAHHRGVPPYPETARYLRRVALAWFHLQRDGTLTPLWSGVLLALNAWQHTRIAWFAGPQTVARLWSGHLGWRSPGPRP